MKFQLKNILAVVAISITLFSCSSDSETPAVNELAELIKFKEITNTTHTIELYAHTGALEQGYKSEERICRNIRSAIGRMGQATNNAG